VKGAADPAPQGYDCDRYFLYRIGRMYKYLKWLICFGSWRAATDHDEHYIYGDSHLNARYGPLLLISGCVTRIDGIGWVLVERARLAGMCHLRDAVGQFRAVLYRWPSRWSCT
jgi:hypothetical protein